MEAEPAAGQGADRWSDKNDENLRQMPQIHQRQENCRLAVVLVLLITSSLPKNRDPKLLLVSRIGGKGHSYDRKTVKFIW